MLFFDSLRGLARRVTGISTPLGGIQLAPPTSVAPMADNSFKRVQDERALMDDIWQVAVSEAFGAKDASRRMQELSGLSRDQVIETYLATQPELRRWVIRNIDAGTCAIAIQQLRERRDEMQQERAEQRRLP